jgi:hypothetical protein
MVSKGEKVKDRGERWGELRLGEEEEGGKGVEWEN